MPTIPIFKTHSYRFLLLRTRLRSWSHIFHFMILAFNSLTFSKIKILISAIYSGDLFDTYTMPCIWKIITLRHNQLRSSFTTNKYIFLATISTHVHIKQLKRFHISVVHIGHVNLLSKYPAYFEALLGFLECYSFLLIIWISKHRNSLKFTTFP